MKKFYFLLLSAVVFAFAGCATDPTADGGPEAGGDVSSKDSFYLDIAMSRPTTRSATDGGPESSDGSTNSDEDPDYEYGYDYENAVNEVLLVFATTDDKFIFSATAANILESPSATPSENFQFTAKASVSKSTITDEYKEGGLLQSTKMVRIYAFCNPTQEVTTKIGGAAKESTAWLDEVGSLTEVASDNKNPGSNNIWASRSFLMTNARVKVAELPGSEDAWSAYTNPDNPFHLSQDNAGGIQNATNGPIYVERTAARIDFSDASEDEDFTYGLVAGRSDVFEGDTKVEKPLNLIDVTLTDMALINMSKGYYALRRVSADGTNTSWTVGGIEGISNYVVDTDYSTKATGYTAETAATGFNYTLFDSKVAGTTNTYNYNMSNWAWDKLSTVVANAEDTWSGSNSLSRKYHIWRYVTENTIPEVDMQQVQQSVGVVFKGQIKPGDDIEAKSAATQTQPEGDPTYIEGNRYISADVQAALTSTTQNSPVLFSLGGLLYAGIKELTVEAVNNGYGSVAERVLGNWYLDAEAESLAEVTTGTFTYSATAPAAQEGHIVIQLTPAIYNYIKGYTSKGEDELEPDWTTGFSVDEKLVESDADFKKLVTDQGVTMYAPSQDGENWGYFCYYFYWNRHNDNGDVNTMGVMEFATVRNNVYKLAVTKLSRLGHPENPQDDPDPLEPGDEDETDDAYFDVQIVVMPWVVRVNDIEF